MAELNARIARLAIALGVSLRTDQDIEQVISRAAFQSIVAPQISARTGDRRANGEGAFGGVDRRSGSDRRMAYKWEELRGLLVLRYEVETTYVQQMGLDATRQIMTSADRLMQRDGFSPGADGVDLRDFKP